MRSRTGVPPAVMSPEQAAEVIHELRAGQVELETQNKELRRAQAELEAARERLEKKHAEDEALLHNVISASTDLIFVKDTKLRTILCSESYARAVGKLPADMYGKNDIENGWLPELVKGNPAAGVRGFEQDDKDALSGRNVHNPADPANVGGELRIFDTTKVPLRDAVGEIVGVIGIARDVTERVMVEQVRARQTAILDATPDFVGFADAKDGRILYVNRAGRAMVGIGEEEDVTRHKIPDVHPQWAYKKFREEMMPAAIRDGVWTGESALLHRSGYEIPVHMVLLAHKSADGQVERFSTISRNITERKILDETQAFLLHTGRTGSGEDFFQSLARYLASTLDMDYVCIDRLDGDGLTARTVAIYNDGAFDTNVSYALKDTPCGDVVGKAICCFPRNVSAPFPNDAALQDLKSESYIGTTLWGSDGKPIGLIALISRKPLTNPALAEAVLKLAAVRAAGDLERTVAEERLRQAHDTLEQRVLQRTAELHEANVALEQEMAQRQTTEVSLRSSEERYRRITEGITDYLYNVQVKDGVAVSTTHNQACEVVTGYAIDEFSANPLLWAAMIPQADRESVLECVRTMLAGGTTQTIEHRIIRKSGEVRWVSATMLPHVDKTGTLLSYDGVIKDITARRTMEEALRLSEEKYRMVADYNHDWEYWLNPAGEFIYVSPSCMRISGYAPHDFKHDRDLLAKITHPDDRVIVETILADAARGSTSTCQSLDLRVIGKDGTERWVNHVCRPVTGSNGAYLGIRGSLREITDRKQMESDLADNERFLRQLTENIQEIFFLLDAVSTELLFVSPAAQDILCLTPGKAPRNFSEFIDMVVEEDRALFGSGGRWFAEGSKLDVEFRIVRADGEIRWLRLRTFPVLDAHRKQYRVAGIAADITAHKLAAEKEALHIRQLQQADKMASLGALVSGVAHEVNNPNNFIMLNSPILRQAWESAKPILDEYFAANGDFKMGGINYSRMSQRIPQLFDGLEKGSRRIQRIVANLKNYARKDVTSYDNTIDVNQVVTAAISLMENMIVKYTNRFSFESAPGRVLVAGNDQKLEQVLINLIHNGCEALTSREKALRVRVGRDEESCFITVRDEGCGIAESDMSQLTVPFFTTKRDSGGTGLGLSVSAGIVAEHGGSLEFESKLDEGTTARVIIPLLRATTGAQ